MDEVARNLKKIARETEVKLAKSVLRWKFRKEGRESPDGKELDLYAQRVAEVARSAVVDGARRLWGELWKARGKRSPAGEGKDD